MSLPERSFGLSIRRLAARTFARFGGWSGPSAVSRLPARARSSWTFDEASPPVPAESSCARLPRRSLRDAGSRRPGPATCARLGLAALALALGLGWSSAALALKLKSAIGATDGTDTGYVLFVSQNIARGATPSCIGYEFTLTHDNGDPVDGTTQFVVEGRDSARFDLETNTAGNMVKLKTKSEFEYIRNDAYELEFMTLRLRGTNGGMAATRNIGILFTPPENLGALNYNCRFGSGAAKPPTTQLYAWFTRASGTRYGNANAELSLRINFNMAPDVSDFNAVRKFFYARPGGEVTNVREVNSTEWVVTFHPRGSTGGAGNKLRVGLSAHSNCSATGAICTSDGKYLPHGASGWLSYSGGANNPQAQVSEPEPELLEADFLDEYVPVSHDGENAFTMRLEFTEDVEISPEDLRDHALSARGGTLSAVSRVDEAKDLFELTVTPSGEGAVWVMLGPTPSDCTADGAVCTAGGVALTRVYATRVRGPGPGLTVADAEATEGEDDSLDFVVTLSPAATEEVTVSYGTLDGTAMEPDDYTAKSGTLTFDAGDTTKTVSVPIVDDTVEDDGETLKFSLSGAMGAEIDTHQAIGTIHNTEGLTATIENEPEAHDGSSRFELRIRFSEELTEGSGRKVARALSISGATRGEVRRVGETRDLFRIPLTPTGEVTVSLGASSGCDASDSVCTTEGRALSEPVYVTIPGPTPATPAEEALTATFSSLPAAHDGETAFTFTLTFSEDVTGLSHTTLQDSAFQVSGGSVTRASRQTSGSNLSWSIEVEPDADEAVGITLPATTDCAATGAICTEDGRMLTEAVPATVPGPTPATPALAPLSASFSGLPGEHDGETAFTFTLELSEDVTGLGHRTLRDSAFQVSGGSVTKAKRQTSGSNESWTIHVEPDGYDAVTVVLPATTDCAATGAICTEDGRMLSNESRGEPVEGPPGLSVADAEVTEATTDVTLAFEVSSSRSASSTLTVQYATSDDTATAPGDYAPTSGTLTFTVGQTTQTVSVTVRSDSVNEGSEALTLTLSSPQGGNAYLADATATGTIKNTGPMPQAWLGRFGRTVADQVLDAVGARLGAARAPGLEARVAGQALSFDTDAAHAGENAPAYSTTRAVTARELLAGTAFSLTGGSAGGGSVSAWGRGVVSHFDGREDELVLDGEVGSLMLGADLTQGRATAGLVLSHAQGSGAFAGASSGDVEANLSGLYPYGRYALSERVSVWGVVGYGQGTLRVDPKDQRALETDMDLAMASVGARAVLLKAPPEGGAELAIKSDALALRTTSEAVGTSTGNLAEAEAEVTRLRFGLAGSRAFRFEGGASLTPSVELGVRHDGGDAETGFGADIGAGLAWSDPAWGLSADVRARGLLTHEDARFSERGFAGSLAWDPAPGSARGPSFAISQTLGAEASGGMEALLRPESTLMREAANDDGAGLERRALEAKLGYGFALFGGRWTGTPELGLGLGDAGRELVLGWRLQGADAQRFEVRLEGSRFESAADNPEHRIGLTFNARW